MSTMIGDLPVAVIGESDGRWRTTTLCLAVDFGSRDDPPARGGVAHLLEHVLMSAPVDGGRSLSERVERLGGRANATTGLDRMFFQAQVLGDHVPEVARLLTRAVLDPQLDEAVLETERQAVLQELAAAAADPSDTVQDAFLAACFSGHPLGRPVGGTDQAMRAMELADVLGAHRDVLLRRRMTLVCTGATAPAEVAEQLAGTPFAGVPAARPSAAAEPAAEPLPDLAAEPWTPRDTSADPDGFSWFATGSRSPSVHDPRRHAFTVLAQLLGPSPASPLYRRLRGQEGLVYAFFTWSRGYTETGAWRIMAGVENRNLRRAQEVVREVLLEIAADGPDPEDLAVARRQAVTDLVTTAERPWDHAMALSQETGLGTRPWSLETGIRDLERVTAEQVRQAANFVTEHQLTVVRPEPA
ncbi:pitrilysin family protein [Streptomyces sp. PanSC9]|uniref:M16 family metallopeptidase n=1 Tax=Streptomyces sp. PanSC9 TaxID=1520461 RepID=UPI000F4A0D80|nr:pitrilysin family protein [Streptomyces sp. PanSC9]ROP47786.1 putative Zn-dependent peptidase [Streptomyces sp. PanSC9]